MILSRVSKPIFKDSGRRVEAQSRQEASWSDSFQGSVCRVAGTLVLGLACLAGNAHAAPSEKEVAFAKNYLAEACTETFHSGRYKVTDQITAKRYADREDMRLDRAKLSQFHSSHFKVCNPSAQELKSFTGAIEGSDKLSRADRASKEVEWKKQADTIAESIFQRHVKEEAQIPQAELEAFISDMPGPGKSCTGAFLGGAVVGGMLSGGSKR